MFKFEIDELEVEVTEGVSMTLNPWLRVEASIDSNDQITIDLVEANCGEAGKANWVRIDDEPQFQMFNAGVLKAAKYHAPERYGKNPNAEHRLLASELV